MKRISVSACLIIPVLATAAAASAHKAALKPTSTGTQKVKVFLVALDDKGKRGKKIGCDDSLVAVTRTIKPTSSVLRAAVEELLLMPANYNADLGNYWQGENLKVKKITLKAGVATIEITGEGPRVAGICDVPRITEQIEATARQFSSVKKVKVLINGEPLAERIR